MKKGDRVLVRGTENWDTPLTGKILCGRNGYWIVKLDSKETARCAAGIEPYRRWELKAA